MCLPEFPKFTVPAYIRSVGFVTNGHIYGTVTQIQVRAFTPLFELPKNGRLFIFVKPLGGPVPELLMQHWSYQLDTLRADATILKPQFGGRVG